MGWDIVERHAGFGVRHGVRPGEWVLTVSGRPVGWVVRRQAADGSGLVLKVGYWSAVNAWPRMVAVIEQVRRREALVWRIRPVNGSQRYERLAGRLTWWGPISAACWSLLLYKRCSSQGNLSKKEAV